MPRDHEDPSLEHYNDGNRAFLQSIMARGTLTFKEGQKLLAAIWTVQDGKANTPNEVGMADFKSYIAAAAGALSPFDYEIRTTLDQTSKERVWAFVNSVSDPLTQMATTRTAEEMFYVKRLFDAMFETYNTKRKEIMAITSMQATEAKIRKGASRRSNAGDDASQAQAADKGVTIAESEKILANLVNEKWFQKSKNNFYSLTPRALMELHSWLVETYNDADEPEEWQKIKECVACREIVTVGQRCTDIECNVRLHNICEAAYWNAKPNKQCPKCQRPWDGRRYVGEMVVTTTEEYLKGQRRSMAKSGGQRSRAPAAQEDVEEEPEEDAGEKELEEEPEEEPEEQPEEEEASPENSSRKRSRPNGVQRDVSSEDEEEQAADDDEAEEEEEESPENARRKRSRPSRVQQDEPSENESDE